MNRREFLNASAAVAVGSLLNFANAAESVKNSKIITEFFTLSNGVKIPKIGLGLWRIPNDQIPQAIAAALENNYRHFDTAQAYGNEDGTGKALRLAIEKGIVKREEIFITSKIRAEIKSFDAAKKSIDETLNKMGLPFIDLMLIHAAEPWSDFRGSGNYDEGNRAVWRALEEALANGKVRAIGVSNFLQKDINNILSAAKIAPMVNQILLHVGNTPFELVDFCKKLGILVEAYSPIAHGNLLKSKELQAMAEKYKVSAAQLCIRYALDLGVLPLPKSANPKHIAQNAAVDFTISAEDLEKLKTLNFKDYGENAHFPVFSGK